VGHGLPGLEVEHADSEPTLSQIFVEMQPPEKSKEHGMQYLPRVFWGQSYAATAEVVEERV
jgi:hypothetical protein